MVIGTSSGFVCSLYTGNCINIHTCIYRRIFVFIKSNISNNNRIFRPMITCIKDVERKG